MELSDHNLAWFAEQPHEKLAQWLDVALRRHVLGEPFAFSPLEDSFGPAETVAGGISAAATLLGPAALVRLKSALAAVMAEWPAEESRGWPVLIELAWRLQASPAIDILEARASDEFLNIMFGDDRRLFATVLAFCRQTLAAGGERGVQFIYRLAAHRLFRDSDARLTLMSLCERAPRHLAQHLAATRVQLHEQMRRIGANGYVELQDFQRELALHILNSVGIDEFARSTQDWYIVRSDDPDSPSDNWLFSKIVFILNVKMSWDRIFIAPQEKPANYRVILNRRIVVAETRVGGSLSDPDHALGRAWLSEPVLVND